MANPTISPAAGDYVEGRKEISITSANGAEIFYTIDGSQPTAQSNRYVGPFTIIGSKTVKAVSHINGKLSSVSSSEFKLNAGKTQSQLGVVRGVVSLSETLGEENISLLKDDTIYIYSDEISGKVVRTKIGEEFYFDGLDPAKTYDFYFSNAEPKIIQNSSVSRAATEKDENGHPLVANKNSIKPETGSGVEVDVELKATGSIKGCVKKFDVTGTEESDHGGVAVFIPGTSYSAYTDKTGNFELSGVPQGMHTVRAQYAGYNFAEKENVLLETKDENIPTTIIEETFNLAFGRGILKGSVVLSDATDSFGLNGISIVITDSTNSYSYTANTSTSGSFSIVDIYPGTYSVELSKEGYESALITDVKIQGASVSTLPTTSLQVIGGSLSGCVTIEGKTDFSGISILAKSETGKSIFAITDSTGNFAWEKVSPGTYTINASYPGYKTVSIDNIIVNIGSEVSGIVLPSMQKATYSISGKVILEGIQRGFEGTSVLVQKASTLENVTTTVTGLDGTFTVSDIDSEEYILTITRDGYLTQKSNAISVGNNTVEIVDDIILKNALGSVKGKAVLESALDNAGINILLISDSVSTTYSTVTDSEGYYSLGGIAPGSWKVQATKSGYNNSYSDSFSVNAGAVSEVSAIELKISHRSIYGNVILEGRTDATGVRITATNIDNTNEIYSALSNKDGFYALSGMTPSEYILSYSFEGYRSSSSCSVSLKEDSSLTMEEITLVKANGKISGIVNLEGCTDHSGILVSLVGTDYTYTTESNGLYEFTVPSGNYAGGVRFSKEDFQLTAKADTIPVLTDSTYGVLTVEMKAVANTVKGVIDLAGSEDDSGITVTIDEYPDLESATTDAEGNWTLLHVPVDASKYVTIRFTRENTPEVTSQVIVKPNDFVEIPKLEMIPDSATLTGHAYLNGMTDNSNIVVTVKTTGKDDTVVRTTSDGKFEVTNILASGSHEVVFSKEGWDSQSVTVSDLTPLEVRELSDNITLADTTAPIVDEVIINSGANYASDTTLKVELKTSEKGSGIEKMGVQIIPTILGEEKSIYPTVPAWQDYAVGFDYKLDDLPDSIYTGNGLYTLVVSVKDKSGNISAVRKSSITITDVTTTLQGVLTGANLHLVKEKSPYLVVADCNVSESDTLIIDAGVEVRFEGEFYIAVSGQIEARGTKEDKILFTSNHAGSVYWNGISINGGSMTADSYNNYVSGNIIEYSEFEYAKTPLTVQSSAYIANCDFHDNYQDHNYWDNYYSMCLKGDNSIIVNNELNEGIYVESGGNSFIVNNIISNSVHIGYRGCERPFYFRNNNFINSSIRIGYSSTIMQENVFESCQFVSLDGSGNQHVVTNNNFIDCMSPIVSTTYEYSSNYSFAFSQNYWGDANTQELELKGNNANISFISDYYDQFKYAKVNYSNWLTEANPYAGYKGEEFEIVGHTVLNCSMSDNSIFEEPTEPVQFNYGASSLTSLKNVVCYLDGVSIQSASSENSRTCQSTISLGLPYMPTGEHSLVIKATDILGEETQKTIKFTINRADTSDTQLAGTAWNAATGQPLKDEKTVYLWHLDSSGAEATNTDATLGSYNNALGGLNGCASYVNTSDSISLDMSTNAFTVEYWIKGDGSYSTILLNLEKSSSFYTNTYGYIYFVNTDNSLSSVQFTSGASENDGKWHYVSKVYSGKYGATYIDGVLVNYQDGLNYVMNNSDSKIHMDISGGSALVDEIRISNAARSGDEIASYYKDAVKAMKNSTGNLGAIVY
ncbi:carboxypeptidase regulatory-like domain-containing protein [Treponema sp.]|uniref:carboxypeptidase regulatory-like domain-containing protein n=1 Tax=Treponema sp. TaxID=166 RepID=UPI003FD7B9B5